MPADPRDLPSGDWTITVHGTKSLPRRREVRGTDRGTGDCVTMMVTLGDLAGYSHSDWGIPRSVGAKIWHVARIEPREEKAKGGTKALLMWLGKVADEKNVWLTTEVKPAIPEHEPIIIALFLAHGQFQLSDPEFPSMLVRSPRAHRTPGPRQPDA